MTKPPPTIMPGSGRIVDNGEWIPLWPVVALPLLFVLLIMALGCLLPGCAPSLKVHERMGKLSAAARTACEAKADRCAAALLCYTSASNAGIALQAARQAIAEGKEDAEASVRAAALPAAAEAVCKVAKVSP